MLTEIYKMVQYYEKKHNKKIKIITQSFDDWHDDWKMDIIESISGNSSDFMEDLLTTHSVDVCEQYKSNCQSYKYNYSLPLTTLPYIKLNDIYIILDDDYCINLMGCSKEELKNKAYNLYLVGFIIVPEKYKDLQLKIFYDRSDSKHLEKISDIEDVELITISADEMVLEIDDDLIRDYNKPTRYYIKSN